MARRFPGLQAMPDSEIIKLIRAERRATGRKLVADTKTRPKTQFTPPPPKRELQTQQPLPFVPVSAPQAKEMTARPNTEVGSERAMGYRYLSLGALYSSTSQTLAVPCCLATLSMGGLLIVASIPVWTISAFPFLPPSPLQRFINVNTPYEAHREDFNTGRLTDSRKGVAPAPFKYTCASQVGPWRV